MPYDLTETDAYQGVAGAAAREEAEGENIPPSEEHPFPPSRYAGQ